MTEDLPWPPPRVIGRYPEAPGEGPTLVVFGGIHGNEPAGVFAARRVAARLAELAPPMRGQFVALAGNRPALARGVRFLEANEAYYDDVTERLGFLDVPWDEIQRLVAEGVL